MKSYSCSNSFIIIIIVVFFIAGLSSCAKKLDQVNPNSLSDANFWKTDADFLQGISASYKLFKQYTGGHWGSTNVVSTTNGRDDNTFIRNDNPDWYQISSFTNSPVNSVATILFADYYTSIYRANQVIDHATTAPISVASKTQFTAEAKFIRAVNYFNLATNFGAVPLITKEQLNSSDYFVKQSPEDQVWQQVILDLQDAAAGLPVSYPSAYLGRATKGAAIGYLGKTYLYLKRWSEAESQFQLLSLPSGSANSPFSYDLMNNYADNFDGLHDNNVESVFEIQVKDVGGSSQSWNGEGGNELQTVATAQCIAPAEAAGWFQLFPTNKLFYEFQKELTNGGDFDPRMYATLAWDISTTAPPSPASNTPLVFYNKAYNDINYPNTFGFKSRVRKYQNWQDANEGQFKSTINEKVLRYSDVLLMYAEALTMQGRPSDAYALVNRVRHRANLSSLPAGYTSDQMMIEIRHQREIEFYREGIRWYDIKRWGLFDQELNTSVITLWNGTQITIPAKSGYEFFKINEPKFAYLPIPQNELNTNKNIQQNPAWQ